MHCLLVFRRILHGFDITSEYLLAKCGINKYSLVLILKARRIHFYHELSSTSPTLPYSLKLDKTGGCMVRLLLWSQRHKFVANKDGSQSITSNVQAGHHAAIASALHAGAVLTNENARCVARWGAHVGVVRCGTTVNTHWWSLDVPHSGFGLVWDVQGTTACIYGRPTSSAGFPLITRSVSALHS